MTKETIDLIIEWFGHIQQMATDRKTLTGAVMDAQHCLNEIAAIASDSKQFVEEYRYEQEPIDEEELDRLAKQSEQEQIRIAKQCERLGQCYGFDFQTGYKEGYRQAKIRIRNDYN